MLIKRNEIASVDLAPDYRGNDQGASDPRRSTTFAFSPSLDFPRGRAGCRVKFRPGSNVICAPSGLMVILL